MEILIVVNYVTMQSYYFLSLHKNMIAALKTLGLVSIQIKDLVGTCKKIHILNFLSQVVDFSQVDIFSWYSGIDLTKNYVCFDHDYTFLSCWKQVL